MPRTPAPHHSPEAIAEALATRLADSLFQLDDEARRILRDALVESIAETLLPSLQALFRPQFRSKFHGGLPDGWIGYYTRKGGTRAFICRILCHEAGDPVIITAKGHVHIRPYSKYQFITREAALDLILEGDPSDV